MTKVAKRFILDHMFSQALYWTCGGAIIASMCSYFKISMATTNILTGFPSTMLVLQLVGGYLYSRSKNRTFFVRSTSIIWRIALPFVFFSALLPLKSGSVVMILSLILFNAMYQLSTPAQTDWVTNAVEGEVESNYYSLRETAFVALFTVAFCLSNLFVHFSQKAGKITTGYINVGILEAVLAVFSVFTLFMLPRAKFFNVKSQPVLKALIQPLTDKAFNPVLIAHAFFSFGNMFLGGFSAIYQIQVMEMSFLFLMVCETLGNVVRTLVTPLTAKLAQRIGWQNTTIFCVALKLATSGIWMFMTKQNSVYLFPLILCINAVSLSGQGVGFLKMIVEKSSAENRSVYFSANATLNGIASLIGSILCSGLIAFIQNTFQGGTALKWVFFVGMTCTVITLRLIKRVGSKV